MYLCLVGPASSLIGMDWIGLIFVIPSSVVAHSTTKYDLYHGIMGTKIAVDQDEEM